MTVFIAGFDGGNFYSVQTLGILGVIYLHKDRRQRTISLAMRYANHATRACDSQSAIMLINGCNVGRTNEDILYFFSLAGHPFGYLTHFNLPHSFAPPDCLSVSKYTLLYYYVNNNFRQRQPAANPQKIRLDGG